MQNQSLSEHIPILNWDHRDITYKNLNSLSVTEAVTVIIAVTQVHNLGQK